MTQISLSKRIGLNLKELIKKSKFKTQDNFALNGIHVDPSTLRKWIKNGVTKVDNLELIAKSLEIQLEELLK